MQYYIWVDGKGVASSNPKNYVNFQQIQELMLKDKGTYGKRSIEVGTKNELLLRHPDIRGKFEGEKTGQAKNNETNRQSDASDVVKDLHPVLLPNNSEDNEGE